jgi:hypothetical protein
MKARQFVLGALIASAGFAAATSFADIYVTTEPPPIRVEKFDPRPGHVYVRGHWEWRNGKHEWVPGHYIPERKGYRYYNDRWVMHDEGKWAYQRGGWGRDSDLDGTPDRIDRAPNNPYRQ